MSDRQSPSTGKPYGVMAVCSTLDVPRSSFYERKRRKRSKGRKHKKRGPVPAVSDEKLLAFIKRDLATSPFTGEGHRKVWARLKFGKGIKVSRKRVLRIMRENNLLSPRSGFTLFPETWQLRVAREDQGRRKGDQEAPGTIGVSWLRHCCERSLGIWMLCRRTRGSRCGSSSLKSSLSSPVRSEADGAERS